jgi:carboxylesterase type B
MLTNNGNQEGLFRAAVMQSGGPIPVGDIEKGQKYYDHMVKETGCSRQPDTLECLRKVPYGSFKRAMDLSPSFFSYQVRAYLTVTKCVARRPRRDLCWLGCLESMVSS